MRVKMVGLIPLKMPLTLKTPRQGHEQQSSHEQTPFHGLHEHRIPQNACWNDLQSSKEISILVSRAGYRFSTLTYFASSPMSRRAWTRAAIAKSAKAILGGF